jgi:hypothetical protein
MQSVHVPNDTLSAMIGHLIDRATAESYEKKKTAWSPDKIIDRPWGVEDEIAIVAKVMSMAEARQRLMKIANGTVRASDFIKAGV